MRYVAAALLTALGGNDITADNIKNILSSVGVEAEQDHLTRVVKELAGKSLEELIEAGSGKLASMPSGGGAAAAAAPAAASGGDAGGAAPAKEEKKVEEEEEEDDDMGFGLFD
uniref:Large ribosomal subunit protein P2 n=1 Tax=Centropages dorsispinatus TaxID=1239308 RepID=A0A0U2V7R0_9MAXI|nr:60S acidic ribosomal protein P2 [Centropages dorsispinatus]